MSPYYNSLPDSSYRYVDVYSRLGCEGCLYMIDEREGVRQIDYTFYTIEQKLKKETASTYEVKNEFKISHRIKKDFKISACVTYRSGQKVEVNIFY